MRIALALSGGGFRATVFHLGVLSRLAEEDQLENVTYLSTVSGGSLCAGLVYALNNFRWPSSKEYKDKILPQAREIMVTKDLKRAMITRALTRILEITDSRADDLSELLQEIWGVNIALKGLPERPRWMINATCYETGKNWRFERSRMGDYMFGYSSDTDVPLSDALAASAGFPGLIGPLALETGKRNWFQYVKRSQDPTAAGSERTEETMPIQPAYSPVHLWDGGVYDNYGLEGLHDFATGWRNDIDFLIVSDASGQSKAEAYQPGLKALERIVTGIMMDQIRSLRAREVLGRITQKLNKGAFLQIGNTGEYIFREAEKAGLIVEKKDNCLISDEVSLAATMKTDIAKLDDRTFERLYRHGFEVADCTLFAYNADSFGYVGFRS